MAENTTQEAPEPTVDPVYQSVLDTPETSSTENPLDFPAPEVPPTTGKVVNIDLMAASMSAATDGTLSVQEATVAATVEHSAKNVRDLAAALYMDNIRSNRGEFDRAAGMGNLVAAEMYARNIDSLNKALAVDDPAKNVSVVVETAALNAATTNEATRKNNTIEGLTKIVKNESQQVAAFEIVSQAIADKYGADTPGLASIAALFGGTLGIPAIASVAFGSIPGLLTGAAIGAAYTYETAWKPSNIIAKITGIPVEGIAGLGYDVQREKFDAYVSTLDPKERVRVYTEIADAMLTELNPVLPKGVAQLFALMNVAKMYDSISSSEWKDGELFPTLSLRMQATIDMLGGALDVAGVVSAGRRIHKLYNVESALGGTKGSGTRVGKDIAEGTPTVGMSSADQTAFVTNADISKILEKTFGGTDGTEAAAAQLEISKMLSSLVANLNDSIRVGADEAAQGLRRVMDYTFTGGMDGSIAHYNAQTNTLVLQHPTGQPFKTREVAQSIAEWANKHADNPNVKFEVVPADGTAVPKLASTGEHLLDESKLLAKEMEDHLTSGKPLKAERVLDAISKDSNFISTAEGTPSVQAAAREVAAFLKEGGVLKNVEIEIVKDQADWERIVRSTLTGVAPEEVIAKRVRGMNGLQGLYDPATNKVFVMKEVASSPSLMLHEIAHAKFGGVLEVALSGSKKAIKAAGLSNEQVAAAENLRILYHHIVEQTSDWFSKDEWKNMKGNPAHNAFYGLLNPHEMVSEILSVSNSEFRNMLKSIPVTDDLRLEMAMTDSSITGKVRNAFDAIVKSLGKLLGVKVDDNSFVHILDQISRLSKDIDPIQQNMVAHLKSQGMTDKAISKMFTEPFEARLSHGWFVRHVGTAGKHTQAEIDSVATIGVDPAHTASRLSVAERFIAQQGTVKDREELAHFVKEGFKGLNKAQRRLVEKVLEEGDQLEREFTVVDLAARGLDAKQQKAYYTARTVSNLAYVIKNNLMKVEQVNLGFTRQSYLHLGGGVTETSPSKYVNVADFHGKKAFDLDTGKAVMLDSAKPLASGQSLIHTFNNVDVGSAGYNLFLGTNKNVRWGSLLDPIPYRAGTFRRIYTDDVFAFVNRTANINGVDEPIQTTLRTARSIKDASKWAKGMNEILHMVKNTPANVTIPFIESKVGRWEDAVDIMTDIGNGKWNGYESFSSKYTRGNDDLVESLARGLHDGKRQGVRGEQRLKAIDDVNRPNSLPPLQALEAEVGNVAFMKNVNEWRQKWVDTWFNTFQHLIPANIRTAGRTPLQIMSDPNWQLSSYRGSDPAVKFAEAQRNYILDQLGVKTLGERMIQHSLEGITSAFSDEVKLMGLPIGKGLVTAGWALRQTDPLQFIRSFNFYSMLSGFNVSQLVVQAAGAGTAVAIHPIHGMKAAYMAPMLRIALASDNPNVWRTIAKLDKVMKLGLGSTQDFMDSVASIRKLGLLKGIAATSMHNVEAGAFNMFGGTVDTIKNTAAIPFNRGEEFARLVSFDVARREWSAKNPGLRWTSDSALQAIMTRTDDYTQNMTNANKAWFQKGVYSIPGQFLQYNIKLAANLVDGLVDGKKARTFTRSEALKVMAFHTVMYGAVGNGVSYMADEITGGWEKVVGREVTDDEKLAISQGLLAAVVNETSQALTGSDLKLALGSRLGVGEFYENFIRGVMRGDQSLWQTVLGPTYSSLKRGFGAAGDLLVPFQRKDYSMQSTLEAINDVGRALTSSWRNATKGYVAMQNNNKLMDEYGVPTVSLSGPEVWFQAFGIGSASESDYYREPRNMSELKKTIKEIADTYQKAYLDYTQAVVDRDPARAERIAIFMNSIKPKLSGHLEIFDAQLKMRQKQPYPYADKLHKNIGDWAEKYSSKDSIFTRVGKPVENE